MITKWSLITAIGLYLIAFIIVTTKIIKMIFILKKHYKNPRGAWRKDDYWNPKYRDESL